MIASTYYIELPDYRMAVLNYFAWEQGSAYWGDSFSAYDDSDYGYKLLSGRLVFDKQGQTYIAPMPDLSSSTVTVDSFFGTQASDQMSGSITYPFGAENPRGYVLYVMQLDEERAFGGTGVNYYHPSHPVRLPYSTPQERSSDWRDRRRVQHYSNFNTALGRAAGY